MAPYQQGQFRPTRKYTTGPLSSKLEIPRGDDPNQNAWLTLTLRYSLNFLDKNNRGDGKVIVKPKGYDEYCALDSDDYVWPIINWDARSKREFDDRYQEATGFWSRKFLIRPPADFDKLDFRCDAVPNFVIRPNILCLFRMECTNGDNAHNVDAVRLDYQYYDEGEVLHVHEAKPKRKFSWGFGSHSRLLQDRESYNTIGHEVGHALKPLEHIGVMRHYPGCMNPKNKNNRECYGNGVDRLDPMGAPLPNERPIWSQFDSEPWREHLGNILNRSMISRLCRKEDFCFVLLAGAGSGVDKHMPERIRDSDYAVRVPRLASNEPFKSKLFPNLKPPTRKIFFDDQD